SEHPNGWPALIDLEKWVDPSLKKRYFDAAENLMGLYEDNIDTNGFLRIHGDLHKGNLLSRDESFFLVDFDDHVMGPAIQDVWMLFSESEQFEFEKESLLKGYEELREFPEEQWDWVPLMRGFRLVGYSAWIARRWKDPSFPRLFPDFNSYSYWVEETEALEKCLSHF
ncbi:MAG: phosphotransferase, partial [Bdellovibrionales bacterium]